MALNHKEVFGNSADFNAETKEALNAARAQVQADAIRANGNKAPRGSGELLSEWYQAAIAMLDEPEHLVTARQNFDANVAYIDAVAEVAELNHRAEPVHGQRPQFNHKTQDAMEIAQAQVRADAVRANGGTFPMGSGDLLQEFWNASLAIMDDPEKLQQAKANLDGNKRYLDLQHEGEELAKTRGGHGQWSKKHAGHSHSADASKPVNAEAIDYLKGLNWKKTGFSFDSIDAPISDMGVAVKHLRALGLEDGTDFGINNTPNGLSLRILDDEGLSLLANNGVNYPGASEYVKKQVG